MENAETVRRELMLRIRTEGVQAAYEAALEVCQNPKSTPAAKSSAASTIFKVAGWQGQADGGSDKEPHEMSAAELDAALKRLRREQDRVKPAPREPMGGIFD